MAATAEKTAFLANELNTAFDELLPAGHEVASVETESARKALDMAAKILKARARQGNVEVNIFDDAAALAQAARKVSQRACRRPHDSDDLRAARVMFALSQAVLAYWGKRTDDGSHVLDSPFRFINEAYRAASE